MSVPYLSDLWSKPVPKLFKLFSCMSYLDLFKMTYDPEALRQRNDDEFLMKNLN
jgi:hypothetical protein